ncbi:oxidoreductase [Streptomyces filipinensis]|uniref:Oxidoreductase n=1 Tax=Streptomyces filipinensis TaxID=66887 RepID=A0A918I7T1_9ACTN|nr:SDR family oxidoreductase [Streptomyces filipinensis]GGU86077.1 oxidoreductase [Streptomyces filipinensis]
MDLTSRRVLVTGASSGIGEAIARDLGARGARVAVLARRERELAQLAREIGGTAVVADLREAERIDEAVRTACSALGGLDAVVNNVGTFRLGYVADGLLADWRDMIELNVLGLAAVTRAAVPYLTDSPCAQVINISSMSGRRVSHPATGMYAATKHAVHALSEALRNELHPRGVRVTVISPGTVDTNRGAYITDPVLRAEAGRDQQEHGLRPEDVAAQVRHVLNTSPDVHLVEIAMVSTRQPPA